MGIADVLKNISLTYFIRCDINIKEKAGKVK